MLSSLTDSITGSLLGTAVGDALGLPCEGLSKSRLSRFFPRLNHHLFFFGKGMISDDTEHTFMVAQSLICAGGNIEIFKKQLAWRLRWWLLGLPAGIGYATLRAIIKLWLGFSPAKSGVFSAGNGPAMRSAIIGVCYGDDISKLREFVKVSTRITHSDIKAEYGALAVAFAAYLASQKIEICPQDYFNGLQSILNPEASDFLFLIRQACQAADNQLSTEQFALQLGLSKGITGYIYHTVPVVIHTWLTHQADYKNGVLEIIGCGGDTDTTAAILGGIIGARVECAGIPQLWLNNLLEFPRNVQWMKTVATRLAEVCETQIKQRSVPVFIPAIFIRNFVFLILVLCHGIHRLFPPY